jgi:hypothetical protein
VSAMERIKFLRDLHAVELIASAKEKALLDKPAGQTSMKAGPEDKVCGGCGYFDAGNSVLSDLGVAAHCLLAQRLHHGGKSPPIIPAAGQCCDRYEERPGVEAVRKAANFNARLVALGRQADRLQAELAKVNEQRSELHQQRNEVVAVTGQTDSDSDVNIGAMARLGSAWAALEKEKERERSMDSRRFYNPPFVKVAHLANGPIDVTIVDVEEGKYGLDLTFDANFKMGLNQGSWGRMMDAYGPETSDWIHKQVRLSAGKAANGNGVFVDSVILTTLSPPLLPSDRTPPMALPPPDEEPKSGPGPNPIDDRYPFCALKGEAHGRRRI